MKKMYLTSFFVIGLLQSFICLYPLSANAQTKGNTLVYNWFAPEQNQKKYPAVLVLGGSEGGLNYGEQWANVLVKEGFGVMALAYFGVEHLNKQLIDVPLEYFQAALDTLKSKQGVDTNNIIIISISKGTEPALLLASTNKSVKLVIAASPSHVVWQGIDRENFSSVSSSWSKENKPIPFVAFDYSKGYYPIINFYLGALEKPIADEAFIYIEKSSARLVLLSGGQDQIWPSSIMAKSIQNRLKSKKLDANVILYDFPTAGHGFLIPFDSAEEKAKVMNNISNNISFLGGDVTSFKEAMEKSFEYVLEELNKLKNQ